MVAGCSSFFVVVVVFFYVRKNPKHCPYCKKSVGYYKRQYLTASSCHRSLTFDVFGSLVDYGRWSLAMYKSWFHMELIINSYVVGKGGKRVGILILSNTKCRFHVYCI